MLSFVFHSIGKPWICTQNVDLVKSNSWHESSGAQGLRTRWAPLMVHGLWLKASCRSTSCPNEKRNIFSSILLTWIGWEVFQAFSAISCTTNCRKYLDEMIFPINESWRDKVGFVTGVSEIWLSAKLQLSVRLRLSVLLIRENRGLIMVRCSMKEYDDGKGKGLSERIKGMTPQGCRKKLHQVFW